MFRIVVFVLVIYTVLRFVLPLRAAWPAKAALSVFIVAAAFKQQFFTHVGGHFFSPELPKLVIEGYTAAFVALAVLFALTLCRDLSLAVGVYGVYEAQRQPRIVEREAAFAELPPEFDGYRIIHLSDLHISASRKAPWTAELVRRIAGLEPDMILMTGDFIDGTVEARRGDVEPLAGLRARDGVFGVLGNHEYYFGWREWTARLEELGADILFDEHRVIRRGDAALAVAGLPDGYSARYGGGAPDARRAIEGAPEGAFVILMDHRPGNARANAAAGADLQLSGHTHGGMVWGLARVIAKYNGGFVNGWYDVDGMKLFVSPGTGIWNGFLTRIGVPSELTVLTLRRGGE